MSPCYLWRSVNSTEGVWLTNPDSSGPFRTVENFFDGGKICFATLETSQSSGRSAVCLKCSLSKLNCQDHTKMHSYLDHL